MKRRAIIAVLLFVALWPIAQRGLVVRYEIDPWKLGAFAMYATPNLPVLVVAVGSGAQGTVVIDEATLPAWVQQQLDRFRVERLALGRLRDPADVGRLLLLARPDLTSVAILVQRSTLDPKTGLIAVATPRYVYERSRSTSTRIDLSALAGGLQIVRCCDSTVVGMPQLVWDLKPDYRLGEDVVL